MDNIANVASTVGNRFSTNLKATFADLTPEKWIRVVIVAGFCECPLFLWGSQMH